MATEAIVQKIPKGKKGQRKNSAAQALRKAAEAIVQAEEQTSAEIDAANKSLKRFVDIWRDYGFADQLTRMNLDEADREFLKEIGALRERKGKG